MGTVLYPIRPPHQSLWDDTGQATDQVADQATDQAKRLLKVIVFCKEPKSREEIQEYLNMKHRDNFKKQVLQPLLKSRKLKLTIPDRPSSPKQKYISKNEENKKR